VAADQKAIEHKFSSQLVEKPQQAEKGSWLKLPFFFFIGYVNFNY
jgi:hypothetical protein